MPYFGLTACHNMQETKLLSEEKLTEEAACVEDFEVILTPLLSTGKSPA